MFFIIDIFACSVHSVLELHASVLPALKPSRVNPSSECKAWIPVYLFPQDLAEVGRILKKRQQRRWMGRMQNFLQSLEEVLTTPSPRVRVTRVFAFEKKVGNAGSGWVQRERLFTKAWRWSGAGWALTEGARQVLYTRLPASRAKIWEDW